VAIIDEKHVQTTTDLFPSEDIGYNPTRDLAVHIGDQWVSVSKIRTRLLVQPYHVVRRFSMSNLCAYIGNVSRDIFMNIGRTCQCNREHFPIVHNHPMAVSISVLLGYES